MGQRADGDLHRSLDKVIAELDRTADSGIALTPELTRHLTRTIGIIRDCHQSVAELEAMLAFLDNVTPIRPSKAERTT